MFDLKKKLLYHVKSSHDLNSATLRKPLEIIARWRNTCSSLLMNIYELSCLEIKEISNLNSNTFYRKKWYLSVLIVLVYNILYQI